MTQFHGTFSLQSACAILSNNACNFKPDDRLNQRTGWGGWWNRCARLTTSVCQRGNKFCDVNYDTHICSQNATRYHGGVTPDVEPSSLLKPEPRFRILGSKNAWRRNGMLRPSVWESAHIVFTTYVFKLPPSSRRWMEITQNWMWRLISICNWKLTCSA